MYRSIFFTKLFEKLLEEIETRKLREFIGNKYKLFLQKGQKMPFFHEKKWDISYNILFECLLCKYTHHIHGT